MSITVVRHKDGKSIPIKLSIWDAFKGAPAPRPRLHECPQCGRFHRPGIKHEAAAPVQAAAAMSLEANEWRPTEIPKFDEHHQNEHNFTLEEDAKIMKMKAEDSTWAKIAESLGNGRTKGMVSHRYKQIKSAETKLEEKPADKPVEDNKKIEKPFEQMSKAEKKAFKAQQAREEGLKKRDEAKSKSEKPKEDIAAVSVKEGARPGTATTAEPVSASELTSGQSAIKERQKWIAVASKHFDKTGQRITPEQARKIMEGAT